MRLWWCWCYPLASSSIIHSHQRISVYTYLEALTNSLVIIPPFPFFPPVGLYYLEATSLFFLLLLLLFSPFKYNTTRARISECLSVGTNEKRVVVVGG
jgi:hypothetical protein